MENLTTTTNEEIIVVDKNDYEVYGFIAGYYGICKKPHHNECILGGDSANHDDYNKEYMESEFNEWDGTLYYTGERYGYRIKP